MSPEALTVRGVAPADEAELEHFIRGHKGHGPGHRRAFAHVERALGHRELSWVAEQRGRIVGYAPAFLITEPIFRYLSTKSIAGGSLVSAGPLTDGTLSETGRREVLSKLVSAVQRSGARAGATWLRWVFPPVADVLPESVEELAFPMKSLGFATRHIPGPIVNLDQATSSIFAGFNSTTRNLIRRAEREGLTASPAASGHEGVRLLAPFKPLSSSAFAGSAAASAYFDAIGEHVIGTAELAGAPIAHVTRVTRDETPLNAVVTCESNGLTYYFLAFNTPEGLAANGNRLALWHAIMAAKVRGSRWFQLGSIDTGVGKASAISSFKRQFGGTLSSSPVAEYCFRPRLAALQRFGLEVVRQIRR